MESWKGWLLLCSHLLLFDFSSSHFLCHPHDSFALLQFKTSFIVNTTFYDNPYSGYHYHCHHVDLKTATWKNGTDCCSWLGVTCHPISGHVTGLDLTCNGLYGDIHQNSTLFHLSHLQSLNLSFNYFYPSPLPSLFGGFVSLTYLNLSNTHFKGEIPSQISHLSKLQSLDLSFNFYLKWKESTWKRLLQNTTVLRELVLDGTNMSSTSIRPLNLSSYLVGLSLRDTGVRWNLTNDILCLPNLQQLHLSYNFYLQDPQLPNLSCIAPSLSILDLSRCYFEGSIPPSFSNLTHLISLDLSWNNLNGSIPLSFSNLTHLISLDLSRNNLYGSIPPSFSNLTHLISLDLSRNNLNGSIPHSFSNLTHLISLDLSRNNLNGSIPPSFSNLTHLIFLDLSGNNLYGSIPPSFSNLTHLISLDLSRNNLNGSIPSSLLTLPRLTSLYLYSNHLSGQIPNVFHHSNRFEELDLSDNNIGGELPSTLSNLHHLSLLDLSYNKFSGQIPDMFVGLTKLNTLSLWQNNLGGKIPSSLFDLTQLLSVDFSNNKLEGPLPNNVTGFSNLTALWFSNNLLNGTIPSWCLSLPSLVDLDLSNNQFTGHISAISSYSLQYLDLCNNKLQGNISESIFSLVNLTHLCLSSNNFTGPVNFSLFSKLQNLERLYLSQFSQLSLNFESNVNYSFSRLTRLDLSCLGLTKFPKLSGKVPMLVYFDLSNNKLDGRLPNWLHEMDSLIFLNLSQNLLTTPMDQFSRNYQLIFLDISFNLLSDGISSSLCNASSIEILNLSHNKLTGIIPQCLVNLSSLQVLDLQMNKLNGTLPSTFSKNNQLSNLNLNGNQLEGLLPESLSNCTYLVFLNLGNNQIEDTFPHWLHRLSNLKVLVLRDNKFHGSITILKKKPILPNLIIFDISGNNFSGSLPIAYIENFKAMKNSIGMESSLEYMEVLYSVIMNDGGYNFELYDSMVATMKGINMMFTRIPTIFTIIDLSGNKFEGEIPNVIGELHALIGLNLSHNKIIGPIPQSMGNLKNLESLDMSSNMLTGGIPLELTNLNYLEALNLSHNNLVGEIPQGKQFDTFSNDSYEGNLGLCGSPLSIKCNMIPEQHPPYLKTFSGEDKFGFGWKPVAIGYGCGMIFGVGLGCCVLLTGKPKWLVRIVGR